MHRVDTPSPDHAALRQTVRAWVARELEPQAARADEQECFAEALFRSLGRELKLFGLTTPDAQGGAGLDLVATLAAIEELSRSDPAFALSYLAHEVLFVHNLLGIASPEQLTRWLPPALSGAWVCGLAMSEPHAGTDVFAMSTRATRKGDVYVLEGTKQWTTNGPVGDAFIVYARTGDGPREISAFVVERRFGGFSVGRPERKMGMRASPTSQLVFDRCHVPATNRLQDEGTAVEGMLHNLEVERLALAAQSCGIALRCLDEMSHYAISERQAFGRFLIEFGQIQRLIAESHAETAAARALLYQVATELDGQHRSSADTDSAKLVATRVGEVVSRNAIQVFGGYGYSRDYPVERLHRDAILLSIGGGSNEAMHKNIARELKRRAVARSVR